MPKNSSESGLSRQAATSRYITFACCASIGCLADLLTKHWVFDWRGLPGESPIWWLWEGFIGIETSLNRGALAGIGQGMVGLFAAMSFVALAGIIVWVVWLGAVRDLGLTITLGCICGGILGNLYDRLGLWISPDSPIQPAVRDWILFRYKTAAYTWPNFNIADSLLVCGAIMLVWSSFKTTESNQNRQPDRVKSS